MKQRYYYIFNGKWKHRLKGEMLYDIIDIVEDKIVESTNSAVRVKRRLQTLNNLI